MVANVAQPWVRVILMAPKPQRSLGRSAKIYSQPRSERPRKLRNFKTPASAYGLSDEHLRRLQTLGALRLCRFFGLS